MACPESKIRLRDLIPVKGYFQYSYRYGKCIGQMECENPVLPEFERGLSIIVSYHMFLTVAVGLGVAGLGFSLEHLL